MGGIRRNGKAYDSADVVVTVFNQEEEEIGNIEYADDQEHQENHNLKGDPTSYSMGKVRRTGKWTLDLNAIRKLENTCGGKLRTIKPFDVNVTFLNEDNEIINDTITWKFKGNGRKITGDMRVMYEYDMFVLGIDFNNA